jgi:hypothetical protein
MWAGKNVRGLFHDQFEVICGLVQTIKDDVTTYFDELCELEEM